MRLKIDPQRFPCWKLTPFGVTFQRALQFSMIGSCYFSTNFSWKNDRAGHFSMGVYFQRYTGATKLVSLSSLFAECGWEKLETRRKIHKLTQFYQIKNNLTPEYLSDLLPPEHQQQHNYYTRNPQNLASIQCRTTYHQNSFFPSCVRLWNSLLRNIKESKSLSSFKNALSSNYIPSKVPSYYYTGSRHAQVLHARLRMRCSGLQQHLFLHKIYPP